MFYTNRQTEARRLAFLSYAASHLGYRARPNKDSTFGRITGYPNQDWNGSFIDYVARQAGLQLPACVSPGNALRYYTLHNRTRKNPQPGDLAFFAFENGEPFSGQHMGIVTDVRLWKTDGIFTCLEAQINSGLPRAAKEKDGVFERTRYATDVAVFARPYFREESRRATPAEGSPAPMVSPSHFQYGKSHASVGHLQLALSQHPAIQLRHRTGKFDGQTRSAYAAWQRHLGYSGAAADGQPEPLSLERLARETGGNFRVRAAGSNVLPEPA